MKNIIPSSRHVLLSGCSGGGKSSLLAELARHGYAVVPEPGRRIVEDELRGDGSALPWVDLAAFAKRAFDLAVLDRARAVEDAQWIFFDRGFVDAAVAFEHATGQPSSAMVGPFDRYHHRVFLTPPWPEIYVTDRARRHSMEQAIDEYERLFTAYKEVGYEPIILPKISVTARANFLLDCLN